MGSKARRGSVGVEEWKVDDGPNQMRGVGEAGLVVVWGIDFSTARFIGVHVDTPAKEHSAIYDESWIDPSSVQQPFWKCLFHAKTASSMARGFYRLGIEDDYVLAELNRPLSAQEKAELRLSMPRQFWPKKWLDEEDTITKPLDSQ